MTNSGARVAVVDDDLSVRTALHRLLTASSFRIQTFGSAQDFINSLASGLPDCLVVDIHMPDVSGLDLHRRLRRSDRVVPTIMITAFDDAVIRARCMRDGVDAYLTKPIDGRTLIDALNAAIGRANKEK